MFKRFIVIGLALSLQACITPIDPDPFARCNVYGNFDQKKACWNRVSIERQLQSIERSMRLDRMSRGGPY